MLVAGIILGGISIFVIDRAVDEYPALVTQVSAAVTKFRHFLTVDLHVKSSSTASIGNTITTYLTKHENAGRVRCRDRDHDRGRGVRRLRALVLHDVLPALRR